MNTTKTNLLTIDFDISFPNLPCALVSIDAIDDSGLSQEGAIHEMYKHKLTALGDKDGNRLKLDLGHSVRTESQLESVVKENAEKLHVVKETVDSCGNCYGAGTKGQCCNTCQDVKDAYARMGWRFKPQGIIQCSSEAFNTNVKEQFSEEGGCQVYGRLKLNKASGHFHIAPHKKVHENKLDTGILNLMDLISFTFDQFNVSHTINGLSFGDQYPGISNPLDGQSRSILDTHGMYQYYLKIVPTQYKYLKDKKTVQSNQYSVTEHMSHLAPGSGRGLPGVYFYYEVSPIQAVIEEKKRSFFTFLTSCCAIIGGAYSVMGLVDLFLIFAVRKLGKESL